MAALITHFPQSVPVLIVPCGGINYPYFTQAPGLIVPWDGTIREKLQFSGLGINDSRNGRVCNLSPGSVWSYSSCEMDRSKTLIAVGIIVVLMGLAQPWLWLYATVTVDTTAPTFSHSAPVRDGTYGNLDKIWIIAQDETSGVRIVSFWDSHTDSMRSLSLESGDKFDGVWSTQLSDWPKEVWISFRFTALDWNYNEKTYAGDFMMLNLGGYWMVTDGVSSYRSDTNWNDIKFASGSLAFKFHETSGAAVTATVKYTQTEGGSASGSVEMDRKSMSLWEGSHSFGDGVYNIEMAASDGFNAPIAASIIQIGEVAPFSVIQGAVIALGGFIVLAGLCIRQ